MFSFSLLVLLLIFSIAYAQENPIEIIKNSDFESGLVSWNAKIYEYSKDQKYFDRPYFSCSSPKSDNSVCLASGWGYPLFGISDDRSPGDRYFYALVPTFYWGAKTAVSLEQEIIIPESSKVTLSFDVQGYSQSQLHIFVKQESKDPILLNQFNVNDKRYSWGEKLHREYDLTEFSGKTIALQFVASEYPFIDSVEEEVKNTGVYFYNVSVKAIPLPVVVDETFNDDNFDNNLFLLWLGIPTIIASVIIAVVLKSRSSKPTPVMISNAPKSDVILDEKYSQENFSDQPILKTGDSSFDSLHQTTPNSDLSDEDYRKLIDDSLHLKALWYIYKNPNRYRNPFDLYTSFDEEVGRKSKIYSVMNDDNFPKLIENLGTKDKREGYILSPLGQHLLEKAKEEKIVTWDKFTKRFDEEIKTGIIKQRSDIGKPEIEQQITQEATKNKVKPAELPSGLIERVQPQYDQGNYAKCVELYLEALAQEPDNQLILSNIGHCLIKQGKYQEATPYIDKALEIEPNFLYALELKGQVLEAKEHSHEAIECYEKVLSIDPSRFMSIYGMGVSLVSIKEFQKGLEYLNKAHKKDPNDPYVFFEKGIALEDMHRYPESLEQFDRGLEIVPDNTLALVHKCDVFAAMKKFNDAFLCVNRAMEIDPDDAIVWYCKAKLFVQINDHKQAVPCFKKSLAINPHNQYARNDYIRALLSVDEFSKAYKELEEFLKNDPDNIYALCSMAFYYGVQGDLINAKKYLDKAMSIDPNNSYVIYTKKIFDESS